jgi:DNA polymerase I
MAHRERVILIDGSSLLYRAFFAIPANFTNAAGLHTNAVYGFAISFKKLMAGRAPAYGAVVFDAPGKTFRDERYAAYKAQRPSMSRDLVEQLPWVDRLVACNNFPLLRVPGYEADDVIGTLTRRATAEGMEVQIISADKDFAQLLGEDVRMIDTLRDITYDPELVRKKWGIMPGQMIDLLALMGDKVDNIPGVPGVGQKGAALLLEKYGSLAGIYEHLEELGVRQRVALEEHRELALLSQDLATIDCAVPLVATWDDLRLSPPDPARLNELYKELQFYSLLGEEQLAGEGDIDDDAQYLAVTSLEAAALALAELPEAGEPVAVHPLFEGHSPVHGDLVGLALCPQRGRALYFPLAGEGGCLGEEGLALLKPWLEDARRPKVFFSFKQAYAALVRRGVEPRGVAGEVQLASFLVDPTKCIPHELEQVAKEYLQRTVRPRKAVTGSGKKERPFALCQPRAVADYACHLADLVAQLWPLLRRRLEAEGQIRNLFEVDLPLSYVLAQMELDGILVDPDDLSRMGVDLRARLADYERRVFGLAGREFNLGSHKQLGEVLFDTLKLPVLKRTKSGYSTDAEVLERLGAKHEIAAHLLEHRKLAKLINTYTDVLQEAVSPKTHRIHATFHQTTSATGRLITTDPDLQRTPVKTPEGKRIRRAFVAREGNRLVVADWSQIELRILAHVSEDELLLEAFWQDLDIHRRTAGQIFQVSPDEVSPEQRDVGKTVNFATIYGQGATALSQQLGVERKEAKRYIEEYFRAYAGVRRWLDDTIRRAHGRGYVETLLGRRRYIAELSSNSFMDRQAGERMAANTPIQGSAADICKLVMLAVADGLYDEGLEARMVLQVHDELVFTAPAAEVDRVVALVREKMERTVTLKVPLKVDVGVGASWGEAKG